MTTVLITGVGGGLAGMVAGALAAQSGVRAIGVDTAPPAVEPPGVETLLLNQADQPLPALLRSIQPDVVVHMAQPPDDTAGQDGDLAGAALLDLCAEAGVRRVVLSSSTLVYGARHDLPAFVDEATPLGRAGVTGRLRDYAEGERRAAELSAGKADLTITILRCAPIAGAQVATPLTRYLRQPTPNTLLGFNPRIQVLHPDDAAIAFALAVLIDDRAGAFNIAADPPLTLGQAIRLAGRQPLPLPGPIFDLADRPGVAQAVGTLPFDVAFLRYSCVGDTRRARQELGWTAQHSAEDALRELAPALEVEANG